VTGNRVNGTDVHGQVKGPNIHHNLEGWRLFMHSSKLNLKVVLLHNSKVLPSVQFDMK
jgi:hypothetical protein